MEMPLPSLLFALTCAGPVLADCGGAESPCRLAEGSYHAAIPDGVVAPPALVFLHGYAASGAAVMRNAAFVDAVLSRGVAMVAPNGQVDALQGEHLDWGVRDGFDHARNDIAFVDAVIADAAERFGLDRDRILLAGFSRGGSMVWDIACAAPELAAAFASHAGGFWAPLPEDCAGPVHLYHSHGFTDGTVPLEGQRGTWFGHSFEMGDVFAGISLWRGAMDCPARASESAADPDGVWSKRWDTCAKGSLLLEIVPGGHTRREDWPDAPLAWFEGLPVAE